VLSLVGLPAGASVLRAAEAAVARLAERPLEVEASTVETIERAHFALLAYVARLLAGNKTSSLALYPGYRALQQLNGAERIHPADLWAHEWAWRTIPLEPGVARIYQRYTVPKAVRLKEPTLFYLGARGAKRASKRVSAKTKRTSAGHYTASATVHLPSGWHGRFSFGSCFRTTPGSGMGEPSATCPKLHLRF